MVKQKSREVSDHVDSFLGIFVTGKTENKSIMMSCPSKIADMIADLEKASGGKSIHTLRAMSSDTKSSSKVSKEIIAYVTNWWANVSI
mmetsp:Transcript_31428/g.97238  ORF Transcript_31428/g.97238 Transcript_31428/m.97238 type:complete len:88 (-) Transcript_31428:1060-1323(-)